MSSRTAKTTPQVEILPPVKTNELDTRQYRAFILPNRMHVLLISDPPNETAEVAMEVGVGSTSDPDDLPGLAHFLEHMLTQGSARFPDPGEYKRFVAEHFGYDGAATSEEGTHYNFSFTTERDPMKEGEVPRFKKALHMFSQYFIAPLFEKSAVEREVNAVHSEFEIDKQNDLVRYWYMMKELSNPAHPDSKHNGGCMESLWDGPRANGVDTRARMIEFFNKFYSANLMNLCIIAPYELDLLQDWVVELFSDVKNHNTPNPCDAYKHIPLLLPEQQGRIIYQETIENMRSVKIIWMAPSISVGHKSKPMAVICRLFNDKTKGSLCSLLKSKGWGEHVDIMNVGVRNHGLLSLVVWLTEKGIDHIEDIVSVVYEYLRLVRSTGIPKWIYEEEKTIRATSFRFRERDSREDCRDEFGTDRHDYAVRLACRMKDYEPEEYISGSWLLKEYAPEQVAEILDCMTPEKSNVIVQGRLASAKADRRERWLGTRYHVSNIPESKLKRWRDPERNDSFRFPNRSQFIPTDFTILAEQLPPGEKDCEGPRCILDDKYMELHYKLDRTFRKPKVSMFIRMETPLSSLWHDVMFELFTDMFEYSLSDLISIANRGGYDCSVSAPGSDLLLTMHGYNHLSDVVLLDVVSKLAAFEPEVSNFERMLKNAIDWASKGCVSSTLGPATDLAEISLEAILSEPYWTGSDRRACLEDGSVNFEAMKKFSRDVLKGFHVTALVYGNITQQSVSTMMQSLREKLGYHPVSFVKQEEERAVRAVQIPLLKDVFLRKQNPNLDDNNSAILIYYQFGSLGGFKVELLSEILEKPTFLELRTVQQLGYFVSVTPASTGSVQGLEFLLQSTVASPDELLRRIDQFLIDVRKDVLVPMSEEQFANYVTGVSDRYTLQRPAQSFSDQAARFWLKFQHGYTESDTESDIESATKQGPAIDLLSVTKKEIIKLFDDYIGRDAPKRRRVVTQVFGALHSFADREPLGDDAIDVQDPVAFKRQNGLYPVDDVE